MKKDIFEKYRVDLVENIESRIFNILDEKKDKIYDEVEEQLLESVFKRVNRIRGGKVQRRKKVDTRKTHKNNGSGGSNRMSASEKRNRRLSQRKGSRKRKATKNKAIKRRKRTLRKRKALGFDKK